MISVESRFLKEFTISIFKSMKSIKPAPLRREIINSDLIPTISEELIHRTRNIIPSNKIIYQAVSQMNKPILLTEQKKTLVREISSQNIPVKIIQQTPANVSSKQIVPMRPKITESHPPKIIMPAPQNYQIPQQSYGKLDNLLKDPTVTLIACTGAGQNITIIRAGERQDTKITLTPEEIVSLFEEVSHNAKVPLIEGVFNAAVDNFVLNAIFSSIAGSRFIIKKQTPYSLLEQQGQGNI